MAIVSPYLSIITLNRNELNSPIKRHRVTEWLQKQDPTTHCLQVTHFSFKGTQRLKLKGWKNIFHADGGRKKQG